MPSMTPRTTSSNGDLMATPQWLPGGDLLIGRSRNAIAAVGAPVRQEDRTTRHSTPIALNRSGSPRLSVERCSAVADRRLRPPHGGSCESPCRARDLDRHRLLEAAPLRHDDLELLRRPSPGRTR